MDNFNNLISIIVPVYNAEKTLLNCIKSVLKQDYSNIELILVNDGSTDSSGKICDDEAALDERIKVIHQKNQGVSVARNTGMKEVSGDFLMFVDSDDQMLPGMIKKMYEHFNDKFGMAVCGYEKITNGRDKTEFIYKNDVSESIIGKTDIALIYEKGLLNAPWNKLYRMDLIKEKGIEFESWCSMGEDLIFNIKYISLMKGNIIVLNDLLYLYNYDDKWLNRKQLKPLSFDSIMRMHSNAIHYAKKIDITGLDYFYELMFYEGLQSLEDYYVYNEIDGRKKKSAEIKKRIHDIRFKKLIVYLRKNKKIGRVKFLLLYNELFRIHQILCVMLRRIKGQK